MRHYWLLGIFALGLTPSAFADYVAYSVDGGDKRPLPEDIDGIAAERLVNVEWGQYAGPQARVGVLEVGNNTSLESLIVNNASSGDDVQGSVPINGIEAMITDALSRSGRFRVVERQKDALQGVLQEQDFAASGRVSQPSGAATGKVLGAEYLVQAVVTAYQPDVSGKDIKVGGLLKDKLPLLGGLKVKKRSSRIGMNLRLINAETSEVIFTKQIQSTISESGLDFGGASSGNDLGLGAFLSKFAKTPMGEATIAAVNRGVYELVKQIGAKPTEGSVVTANASQIIVNLGKGKAEAGERFNVLHEGKPLIDPDTGLSLGAIETAAGVIEIASVQDKFSVARLVGGGQAPQRGDKVVSAKAPPPLEFGSPWSDD
jgi:curli biogenesis system outer membrane secretion channel CsgG